MAPSTSRFAGRLARAISPLVALLAVSTLAAADSPEGEVKAVLDAQQTAWNKGDLDGFMAGYWKDDALFFISGGKTTTGWKPVRDRYDAVYRAEGKEMGKLKFSDVRVEVLAPTAAFVRGKWELTTSKEKVGGWYTLILSKKADGWKIVHDHTSK